MSRNKSIVQGSEVSFELHTLGWKAFQDLCLTITSEILGQTVQQFLHSKDGGRDGAFSGTWDPDNSGEIKGTFTIQCKYTNTPNQSLTISMLAEDLQKAKKLAEKGLAENYILISNHKLSGVADEKISDEFKKIDGINTVNIYGYSWVNQKIRESARLRMLVPRVYGLGDLSQIIDERVYQQTKDILNSMGEDLSKFVITDAYSASARALQKHSFVMLLGEPASGKTTIAASLAVGASDNWRCQALKISSAAEFTKHWNPHEHEQLFWVDDAFGITQYQNSLVGEWNSVLLTMRAAIKKGTRIIFTSRDYIYNKAKNDLKVSAFPLLKESQVIINVESLSGTEKEQILYNHIKLGNQKVDFKLKIKPFLKLVARNPRFLPEIARRFGDHTFTVNLSLNEASIISFVEKPVRFLTEIVSGLDADSKGALALIFMNGGIVKSPLELTENEEKALKLLETNQAGIIKSLISMNKSIFKYIREEGEMFWKFKHPTIADAYASLVGDNPELLDIYIAGTKPGKMIREIVCGDIEYEGAKIFVPKSRYKKVINSIQEIPHKSNLYWFLLGRCDDLFLDMYCKVDPSIISVLCNEGMYYLEAELSLLARLHQAGILKEAKRKVFVTTLENLSINTLDTTFFDTPSAHVLLTDAEYNRLKGSIIDNFIMTLPSKVSDLESNFYNPEGDPESHFSELNDALEIYQEVFKTNKIVIEKINDARYEIENTIEYLREQWPPTDEFENEDYHGISSYSDSLERDVFEDIDK